MEVLGNFLRAGILRSLFQKRGKASASCILLRILHSARNQPQLKKQHMVFNLLELELIFLVLMTSTYANFRKNHRTSGAPPFASGNRNRIQQKIIKNMIKLPASFVKRGHNMSK